MPPLLKFLRLRGSCTEKDLDLIDRSIQFAESNQISVVNISDTDEVKKLIADSANVDQSIYVCMPFEGKIFDKLKAKGYRIIGPQCVVSCLLLEMPVPKRTFPVCNISMLNTVICCSSMKKEERSNIQQLVITMGGEVSGDFTLAVTHLVAKEVGSKKYEVACSNNIPTVTPSWIHTAWEKSQYDHFIATENNNVKEHLIPVFKGCTVCVTGIDATKRDAIKTIVQKNGGVYSGELNMKTCTHLLVEHPQGQKYNHARQWKLHCVSPAWLYDSLKKKHWISEKPYYVEPDPNSTSNNDKSILQQSKIQNTILGANTSRLSVAEKTSRNTNTEAKVKSSKLKIKVVSKQSIDISNVKMNQNNFYLEECKIHLSNKPGPLLDLCKKIVNNGAGIRSNNLNESITHIVVWDQIPSELNSYLIAIKENNGMFPHVVSPTWLIDCCRNGKIMLEEDYSLIEETSANETVLDDAVFAKPKLPVGKPRQTSTQLHMQFEDEISDENTLLDQYLNHESTRISQFGEAPKGKPNLDDVTQGDETTMLDGSVLERKKFAVNRFADDQMMQVKNLISEYGGEVVDTFKSCEFIIVPLSEKQEIPVNPKEVTLCWLEQSIENQKLQDPKSSFIYKPIHLPDNVKPLQNCVITISQYTGIERQHLLHLAELLGGVGQEYFVRNDTATMKASTHLILMKPEGSKYDASIKWKIPCVGREWIFRCAKTKRRLPEGAFSMSNKQGNKEVIMLDDEEEEEEEEKGAAQAKEERPRPEITVEETNAHAWEKKNEKNYDPDITIEETNAHAWEKKEPVPAEKSIIAQAPNDITGDITIDFSTRGASLMDGTSNTQVPNPNANSAPPINIDADTPEFDLNDETAPLQMSVNQADDGDENDHDHYADDKSPTNHHVESDHAEPIEFDVKTPKLKNDFSAFNAIIAHERRSANRMDTSSTRSPMVSASLPPDFDKSNFSFDFTDALDAFPSPLIGTQDSRRKSRKSRVSLPLEVQFTEALQRAVEKHCHDDEEVFMERREQPVDEDEEEEGVFQGVVVAISKKLLHRQSELHGLTTGLGGEIRYLLDNSCTHFIHQGKMSDTTKDFLDAKKKRKYLVSPHWLKACNDANERLDEKDYPVTYNPRMTIDVTSPKPVKPKTQEKIPPVPIESPDKNNVKSLKKATEIGFPSPKEVADVQKKMQDIMNAVKAPPKNERRTRRQTANLSTNKTESLSNRKMRNRSSSQKNESASSSCSDGATNGIDVINEQSQGGFITYDDPTARLERARILEHLKRASPSQDIESLCYPVGKLLSADKDDEKDGNTNNEQDPKKSLSPYKPQISLPITNASAQPESVDLLYDKEAEDELKKIENAKNYKFIFSGMNAQEKIDYGGTIEELGGTLFDVQYFNTQSSHLIVKAPTKNEKYLASLASGKWALHKSFLDASREANDFVNELDHEWGSQSNSNELALAARRWRIELAEKRKSEPNNSGAFDGWVVLLCIESSKQPGFKRILEAGGAKLLAVRPPFDNIQGATHAFIGDRRQLAKAKIDLRDLHDAGVWVLKPEYIADYLVNHPKPPTFEYVLDDVKAFDEEQPAEIDTTQRKRKASEAPKAQKKAKR